VRICQHRQFTARQQGRVWRYRCLDCGRRWRRRWGRLDGVKISFAKRLASGGLFFSRRTERDNTPPMSVSSFSAARLGTVLARCLLDACFLSSCRTGLSVEIRLWKGFPAPAALRENSRVAVHERPAEPRQGCRQPVLRVGGQRLHLARQIALQVAWAIADSMGGGSPPHRSLAKALAALEAACSRATGSPAARRRRWSAARA
jgi:hypothetical protein